MSKNDAPFMVQIWSAEGWRDGWTIAQPYSVSGGNFVFFLRELGAGGDGNNIHIHKLRSSGKMREENAFVHSSSEGWTSVRFYKANNKIFLFLLKRAGIDDDGNNVHIYEMKDDDGDLGPKTFAHLWTSGWSTAEFYFVGSRQFLFLHKAVGVGSDNHNVHIQEVSQNGDVGTQLFGHTWPVNPFMPGAHTIPVFYKIGDRSYLLRLTYRGSAPAGQNADIFSMGQDGNIAQLIASYDWTSGWTSARVFKAGDGQYLFLLNAASGKVNIHHLTDEGRVGQMVWAYDRTPWYTKAFGTGSLAPEGGPVNWTSGWTNAEFITTNEATLLFAMKQQLTDGQVKRAKICQINPMESVGPMVGHVNQTEAFIWVGSVGGKSSGEVTFRALGQPATAKRRADLVFDAPADKYYNAGAAYLSGLSPNTMHQYEVRLNNRDFGSGSFRTAPRRLPGTFSVAIASCMDLRDRDQSAWDILLDKDPDLLILGGDNAYANTTLSCMVWAEHLQQRGVSKFANVIKKIPTFATWDDHDFGPNNPAGGDYELHTREESQRTFAELFKGLPFAATQGIYYKFQWRDVDFFMLDGRYFRNHYLVDVDDVVNIEHRQLLGDVQWTWLENELRSSDAKFKVLISGITVDYAGAKETWQGDYPREWTKLKGLAIHHEGVVLISGDIHSCGIRRHEVMPAARVLIEFTSSGVARNNPNDGFIILKFDTRTDREKIIAEIFTKDGSLIETRTISLQQTSLYDPFLLI